MLKDGSEEDMCMEARSTDKNYFSNACDALSDEMSGWKRGTDELFSSLDFFTLLSGFIPPPEGQMASKKGEGGR